MNNVTSLFIETAITYIVYQSQFITLVIVKNIVKFIVLREQIRYFL